MSSRTFWILVAVAVALSGYVYRFEGGVSAPWQKPGSVFPDLEPTEIVEMRLERPRADVTAAGIDARPVLLRREGKDGEWWIVEPMRFPAFHPRAQSIAYDLADLTRIAEAPEAASAFAGGPELVLRFKTREGKEQTVEIGSDHPDSKLNFTYVRVGPSIFVTRKELRKVIDVGLPDLRSRALFGIPPADAASLEIDGEPKHAKSIARARRADRWRLTRPVSAQADRELVEKLLGDLNAWTIASFEKDDVNDPQTIRAFGLDSPRAVVTLRPFEGKEVVLEVGAEVPVVKPTMVYVRLRGEASVFRALAEPTESLFADPETLRARYLFDWGLDEVVELSGSYRANGAPPDPSSKPGIVLRRLKAAASSATASTSAPGAAASWEVEGPDGVKVAADLKLVEGRLTMLNRLLVQERHHEPLATVRGKLLLKTRDGQTYEALLGEKSTQPEDAGQNLYEVMVPGEPTAVLVSTILPPLLEAGPVAFRNRSVSDLHTEEPAEIVIVDGERRWELARLPGEPWMVSQETPIPEGKTLDFPRVDQLLLELDAERLRAVRFLPEIQDFAAAGLSLTEPRRGIEILKLHSGNPSFRKLVLGGSLPDTNPVETRARMDAPGLPAFTVEPPLPRAFEALVAHLREVTTVKDK